jgi:hypothetical protein
MWLFDAELRQLRNLHDAEASNIGYTIMSHTWGEDEPSFQNIQSGTAAVRNGYLKVDYACRQTIRDGFRYTWIDTICIDKTSSAELSEAINSMFRWYEQAALCYAYLSDVSSGDVPMGDYSSLRSSRWFTRGWTLQELIAPAEINFYSQDWNLLGSKAHLVDELVAASGVPGSLLVGEGELCTHSIANRMSWAAKRQTTRPEDRAYCLLGLFDVNIPMLYGEGGLKAFYRLQEAILKTSVDHSILVWKSRAPQVDSCVFAPSPDHFDRYPIVRATSYDDEPLEQTTLGLKVHLPVVEMRPSEFWIVLNCRYEDDRSGPIMLQIERNTVQADHDTLDAYLLRAVRSPRSHVLPVASLLGATRQRLLLRMPSAAHDTNSRICQEVQIEVQTDKTWCHPILRMTDAWVQKEGRLYITSPWDPSRQDATASITWQHGSIRPQIEFRSIVPAGLRPQTLFRLAIISQEDVDIRVHGWTWLVDHSFDGVTEISQDEGRFRISHSLMEHGAMPVYLFHIAFVDGRGYEEKAEPTTSTHIDTDVHILEQQHGSSGFEGR